MVRAPFGMADDHGGGPEISQHLGRDVAGMGSRRLGMAILSSDRDARSQRDDGRAHHQRRRRTNQEVGPTPDIADPGGHLAKLRKRRPDAVHLPVPRDQRPHVTHCASRL